MSVHLDGSTLSALLFSHFNNGNQYGFLTGEKIEHVEDKISDSQIHVYDVNSYLYVSSFVPWPHGESIYTRGGHINDDCMQQFFSHIEQNLIGWYSFRHNTSSRPSLREANLHLALLEKLNCQPQNFLFLLCTSSSSEDMSTHTCNYSFMQPKDGNFFNLPITVMNLGDTTRKEYRKRSNATLSHSQIIQGSLHSFRKEYISPSGEIEHVDKIKHMSSSIYASLMSVHSKIADSEKTLGLLDAEVDVLRQKVDLLEQEEIETMFEIKAEKRRKEIEEERKEHDAKEEAEEQEQLQKLLTDLGMSKDLQSVTCNTQPDSNNSNRNTNCAIESSSAAALPLGKHKTFEQLTFLNGVENGNKNINKQTAKGKTSDTFDFIEELLVPKNFSSKRQDKTDSCRDRSTPSPVMHNQSDSKHSALDIHELSSCEDELIVQEQEEIEIFVHDTKNEGSRLIQKFAHIKTSNNANETLIKKDVRGIEDLETSESDVSMCDDKIIVSSSPVF